MLVMREPVVSCVAGARPPMSVQQFGANHARENSDSSRRMAVSSAVLSGMPAELRACGYDASQTCYARRESARARRLCLHAFRRNANVIGGGRRKCTVLPPAGVASDRQESARAPAAAVDQNSTYAKE